MPDRLIIDDLELWTRIGVTDAERASAQRVLVRVDMGVDTRAAAESDDHRRSVDYAAVRDTVRALVGTERKTIERLAEDVAGAALRLGASDVIVTVTKFPFADAKAVNVLVRRGS